MARIVMAVSPLTGHVLPMVLIGGHLQRAGHTVTVLTDEAHRHVVEGEGLAFAPLGPAACAQSPAPASALNRLLPSLLRRYLLGKADIRATFVEPLVAQYLALAGLLDAEPVDAVLVDLAFTGALPILTSDGPRPTVFVCGVGPLTLSSTDTPPFGMSWIPRPGMDYDGMHAVVRNVMFGDIADEVNAALREVGASPIETSLMDWPRLADRLLQLTIPAFEYPRSDLPGNVSYVGPVLPETDDGDFEAPQWWDEVLRAQTVVHVTQGTLDNGDLDQLIVPTLRAFADVEGVVVVATTGRGGAGRLPSDIPSNAHVAEWIPYSALLPHVDVAITNGGYGGVQHALRYGIPVVVAGESADKAEVAARVEFAGVGVNVGTAHPSPSAIAGAVARADRCRNAAALVGAAMAKATPLDTIASLLAREVISA